MRRFNEVEQDAAARGRKAVENAKKARLDLWVFPFPAQD